MQNSQMLFTAIFPPAVVLILGFMTRRVMLSLCVGILLAGIFAKQYSIFSGIELVAATLVGNLKLTSILSVEHFFEADNVVICLFLLILGALVSLLQKSGGAFAVANKTEKYITDAKSAETNSLILSSLLFIDDYLSSLTVGSVMAPITDKHNVPRVKLSLLVDSLAAPLAIMCPFSSWVAAILGFLKENGVSSVANTSSTVIATPMIAYINIIPFMLYSIILYIAIWYIVKARVSFGPIARHESIAAATGDLFGAQQIDSKYKTKNASVHHRGNLADFIVPVLLLIIFIFLGMLYSGNCWLFAKNTASANSIITALQNCHAATGLFIGGVAALILSCIYYIALGRILLRQLPAIIFEGSWLMVPPIIVLMLAWSLGDILRDHLNTGQVLAELLLGTVPLLLLPCILFFASVIISFALGSSWGTTAMMFPIAIPMVISLLDAQSGINAPQLSEVPLLVVTLGAVLSGAVAGDHTSPISDTSIMTATSTKTPLLDHIYTQLWYAIPVVVIAGFSYILASYLVISGVGLAVTSLITLSLGILTTIVILYLANLMYK